MLTNIKKIMSQTEVDFHSELKQYIDAVSESRPFNGLETAEKIFQRKLSVAGMKE